MIYGDYHTHTIYSHGKGSVDENVRSAVERGLKEIAITDHGFSHLLYNVRKSDFVQYLKDIEDARQKYPEIKIYSGLETNLIGYDGQVDFSQKAREMMDIAICGYHKCAGGGLDFFSFTLPKMIRNSRSKRAIIKNTDAYINAMNNYDIDFISHPNVGMSVDILELGRACSELDVFLELNGKRLAITDEQVLELCKIGCKFIANSDAHSPSRVGIMEKPLALIERLDIGEYVVNYNKLPTFRGIYKDED